MSDGHYPVILLTIGVGMTMLTMIINVGGVVAWLKFLGRYIEHHTSRGTHPSLFNAILSTTIVLLSIHAFEAFLWAVMYLMLPGQAGLENLHDAFYFSVVTMTTLGYGDITLNEQWQMLSGLESMIGIILFGMTTAMIYAVVQKCWMFKQKGRVGSAED